MQYSCITGCHRHSNLLFLLGTVLRATWKMSPNETDHMSSFFDDFVNGMTVSASMTSLDQLCGLLNKQTGTELDRRRIAIGYTEARTDPVRVRRIPSTRSRLVHIVEIFFNYHRGLRTSGFRIEIYFSYPQLGCRQCPSQPPRFHSRNIIWREHKFPSHKARGTRNYQRNRSQNLSGRSRKTGDLLQPCSAVLPTDRRHSDGKPVESLFSLWMLIIPCHEAVRSRNRKTTNRMAVTDLFISLSQVKKQSDGGHIV